jgi:sarcosine oxidase, subunit alpha
VRFWLDGEAYEGREGEPVAIALWAAGVRTLGWNEAAAAPRGLYCAIGHCFECRLRAGDALDQRACLLPVREGLRLERQTVPPPLANASPDGSAEPQR